MRLNRRTFLQQASISLLTYGGIFGASLPPNSWLNKYQQTLAQSTSRKLALLVGINEYSQGNNNNLRGCVTDVELQRELLIYRFGFKPEDIIILTNNQATRIAIETAFVEHLIKQVTEDDVVIFHFSGFGRQVEKMQDLSSPNSTSVVNSLIPHDGFINNNNQFIANDILLETLELLGQNLATNKLTIVLDTSYQKPNLSFDNNLILRSYFSENLVNINPEELAFITQLKNSLQNKAILNSNSNEILNSILSANETGIATEIVSNNFNAGLFTSVLTQYLWQSTPPNNLLISLSEIASKMALINTKTVNNTIELNKEENIFPYYLFPQPQSAGEALIKNINQDNTVEIDLVGLPILISFNYGVNSCFKIEKEPLNIIKLQISDRKGKQAKGLILNSNHNLKIGDILREYVRVFSRNLSLKLALNNNLERIEKVDATSSLSSIKDVVSVINMGEDFPDCILGKISVNSALNSGYGLFSSTGFLFPNTIGKNSSEAVSTAVNRLIPQLKILFATKLLHLTFNQDSSLLPVSCTFEVINNQEHFLINKYTLGSKQKLLANNHNEIYSTQNIKQDNFFPDINIGSKLTFTISNHSEKIIYFLLFCLNSDGKAIAYFATKNNLINENETINLSDNLSNLIWLVNPSKGLGELILICSPNPFNETLLQLDNLTSIKPDLEEILPLENPIIIAKSLLQDLHKGSNISNVLINNLTDVYALDINTWATFNFVYQIN